MMGLALNDIAAAVLIMAGVFFLFAGSLGILRLPDFYTRTHASSKIDTLGMLLVMAGLIVFEGMTLNSIKLGFILIFIALANPIGSHALARAAMASGLKPLLFTKEEADRGSQDSAAHGEYGGKAASKRRRD